MSVPFAYRVLPDGKLFAVVCIHQETPDWWHVVARFADAERARRYAEVEGDCASDDFSSGDPNAAWEGDERPAPVVELPAPPPTRVTPENFRSPSPAEKARVGAALIGEAAQATGTAIEVRAIEPRRGGKTLDDLDADLPGLWHSERSVADIAREYGCSTATVHNHARVLDLGPRQPAVDERPPKPQGKPPVSPEEVERRIQAVHAAIVALHAEGAKVSYQTVAERAGMPHGSIAPAIKALQDRGIIRVFGHGEMDATDLRERGGIRLVGDEETTSAVARDEAPAVSANEMATWRAVAELLDGGIQPGVAEIGRKAKELGASSEFVGGCLVKLYRLNLVQRNNDNTLTLMKRPPGPVPAVAARPEVEDRPAARNEPPGYQLSTETRETRPFWTSDRVGSFKRMWIDGATHKHIAAVFQITTDRVEQLRKQFGLKDRSVFTGVGA